MLTEKKKGRKKQRKKERKGKEGILQGCDFPVVEKSFALQTVAWSSLGSKLWLDTVEESLFSVHEHTQKTELMTVISKIRNQFSFPDQEADIKRHNDMQCLIFLSLFCRVNT